MIDLLPALLQEAEFFAHGDGSVAGGYKIASSHSNKKPSQIMDSTVTKGGSLSTGSRFEGFAVPIGLYLDTSLTGGSQKYKHTGKIVDRGYMEEDQFGILLKTVTVHKPKPKSKGDTKKTAAKKPNEKTQKKRTYAIG
jgi:hypothetical protein